MDVQRTRRFGIGIVFVLFLAFVPIAGASAHDELVASNPAPNATLKSRPSEISLTFTAPPAEGTSSIVVSGGAGDTFPLGDVTVSGNVVTAPWPREAGAGRYGVAWRSTGSDGHALSGAFAFTYFTPNEGPTATRSGSPDASALSTPSAAPQPTSAESTSWLSPVLVFVGLALAAILIILFVRRQRANEPPK